MRIPNSTKKRRGAGMVEYGLIVGLIAVGAIVAVQNSGDRVSSLLNTVSAELNGVRGDVMSTPHGDGSATGPTGCQNVGDTCSGTMIYAGTVSGRHLFVSTQNPSNRQSPWTSTVVNAHDVPGVTNRSAGGTDYAGYTNTEALINDTGVNHPAAQYCWDRTWDGHGDWYLPSQGEIAKLEESTDKIGFLNGQAWSSTEVSDYYYAHVETFGNGVKDGYKTNDFRIYCIRSEPA